LDAQFIDAEITKLAPVAGQVLLLQTPAGASLDDVMHVLKHVNQLAPDGVHVACIDSNFQLQVTNVPELVAMLQKPDVTH
jgi:DNA-directed RNA polymerase specialized sigma54-like protein